MYPTAVESRWNNYDWQIIPPVPQRPAINLALDDILTAQIATGNRPPTIRFWRWSGPCIILGRYQSAQNEIYLDEAKRLGIPVVRRISGGGTIIIEPEGAVTWSIYTVPDMVKDLTLPESYAFFDRPALDTVRALGIDAWYKELNDIMCAHGKISGAAQVRRQNTVLHHTTMAYDMTGGLLPKVLRVDQEKLSVKGVRSANKIVAPLRSLVSNSWQEVVDMMLDAFQERTGGEPGELTAEEMNLAEKLVAAKYDNDDWTYLLP